MANAHCRSRFGLPNASLVQEWITWKDIFTHFSEHTIYNEIFSLLMMSQRALLNLKRRETRRNPKYFKAAINCRTPKRWDVQHSNDEHTSGNAFLIEVFVLLHCIHIHNRDSQTSVLHETWTDKWTNETWKMFRTTIYFRKLGSTRSLITMIERESDHETLCLSNYKLGDKCVCFHYHHSGFAFIWISPSSPQDS